MNETITITIKMKSKKAVNCFEGISDLAAKMHSDIEGISGVLITESTIEINKKSKIWGK